MLSRLPKKRIQEVRDYIEYLIAKERKHKAFADRVLKAESGPYIECDSVEKVMEAVHQAEDEED